jgi:hypothetical protein
MHRDSQELLSASNTGQSRYLIVVAGYAVSFWISKSRGNPAENLKELLEGNAGWNGEVRLLCGLSRSQRQGLLRRFGRAEMHSLEFEHADLRGCAAGR